MYVHTGEVNVYFVRERNAFETEWPKEGRRYQMRNVMDVMSRSKIWQYGVPFMIFILGGLFGLREFTELRYRYKHTHEYKIRDELEKKGIQMRQPEELTLEKEYEKLEKMDLDNWENIRISRPWDESEHAKAEV